MRVDISTDKCGKTYPWVGIGNTSKHIVLFTSPKVGTIIYTNNPNGQYVVGHQADDWGEQNFTAICITLDSVGGV